MKTLDESFVPAATKYFSLIALGLSLVIGYVVWRVVHRGASEKPGSGEEWLEEELERIRSGKPSEAKRSPEAEEDGSGLAGPAYTREQQELLRRAKEDLEKNPDAESEHHQR